MKRTIVLSALLHLLAPVFVARCDPVSGWLEADEVEASAPEIQEPIVFEFVDPPPGPEPEVAPETNLVSTKKSLARTETEAAVDGNEQPFSIGESPVKETRAPRAEEDPRPTTPGPAGESPPEEGEWAAAKAYSFSPSQIRREVTRSIEESRYDNSKGSAALPGDLSFNTVDFEFAPYLLELKRRIEEKWYPPVAFRGGLPYGGAALIRFAVEKDGTLGLLELVEGADHKSLDTAAMNAVRFGAPFPPLPDDFPEKRWVITCTFYYR
ncbi:MAG: TonB family protein [Candidatus Eisenbacteria bacterium]